MKRLDELCGRILSQTPSITSVEIRRAQKHDAFLVILDHGLPSETMFLATGPELFSSKSWMTNFRTENWSRILEPCAKEVSR